MARHPGILLAWLGAVVIGGLGAQDDPIVGPRALGMGGTGVSSCDDHHAQYYNPALLGFFSMRGTDGSRLEVDNNDLGRKSWGGGFDVSAGYAILGGLAEIIDELHGADLKSLAQDGLGQSGDLQRVATIIHALADLGLPGNAVIADARAGLGMRIGRWAVGIHLDAQSTVYVLNSDLASVALSASGAVLANRIVTSGAATDGQVSLLNQQQARTLYEGLGGNSALPTDTSSEAWQAVQRIDLAMRQAGIAADQVERATSAFSAMAAGTGLSLDQNTTVISLAGFGLAEIPVSYGHPINEHLAVGATLKGMVGRVYRNEIPIFSNTASDSLEQTFDAYRQTFNLGLDLSLAVRSRYLQTGLILRNLNRPSFAAPTINGHEFERVVLTPQATIGQSIIPWDWLTLAVDMDLNDVAATTFGHRQQRLGTGIEITPWHAVALRAGAYQNLADARSEPVFTLGAGLNLWALRVDAALAASPKAVTVQGMDVPEEMRVSLGVMTDF